MPYLVLLILLALVGGPWLVLFALTLTGVWFAFVWTLIGFFLVAGLICTGVVIAAVWSTQPWRRKKAGSAFGAALSADFKQAHAVEPGVWKTGTTYMVEQDNRTFYFRSLAEARAGRDNGIEGYIPAVPITTSR